MRVAGRLRHLVPLLLLPSFCPGQQRSESPLANIAMGWTYLWAAQASGDRSNLNGWFARPALSVSKSYAVFASFTNYYGANHKGSINSHGHTLGVSRQVLARPRLKPSIFVEAGDVRSSNHFTIVNQFGFATGASFAVPLKYPLSLIITPAEYVFLHPNGSVRNDYNAKLGLSYAFGHR